MINQTQSSCLNRLLSLVVLLTASLQLSARDGHNHSYANLSFDSFSTISGGNDTGTSIFGLLDIGLGVPISHDISAYVSAYLLGGENASVNVGDFNGLNNNAGVDGVRLYRAFLTKEFEPLSLILHAGKLAVDDEFMLSDHAHLFINSGFGILPTVSGNTAIPNFPISGLGLFAQHTMGDSGYLQAGIYDGNTGSETSNRDGLNNALSGDDGAAIFVEAARHTHFVNRPGTTKLGINYNSGEFEDFSDTNMTHGNYSLYFSHDQAIIHVGEETLVGVFYRAGYSPTADRNVVSFYNDVGIVINGPLSRRSQDQFGLGFSYTHFSNDYVDNQRRSGTAHRDHEIVLELVYHLKLLEEVTLIPDLQYIISPATGDNDALVMGARLELAY